MNLPGTTGPPHIPRCIAWSAWLEGPAVGAVEGSDGAAGGTVVVLLGPPVAAAAVAVGVGPVDGASGAPV